MERSSDAIAFRVKSARCDKSLGERNSLSLAGVARAGIGTVIIPKLNEKDLVDVPAEAKEKLKFVPVETVDEVLANALERRDTH